MLKSFLLTRGQNCGPEVRLSSQGVKGQLVSENDSCCRCRDTTSLKPTWNGLSGHRPSSPFDHGHYHLIAHVWPIDSINIAVAFQCTFLSSRHVCSHFPHCLILYLWMTDVSSHLFKKQRWLNLFVTCLFCFDGRVHLELVVRVTIMTSLGVNALSWGLMKETISIYISGCQKSKWESGCEVALTTYGLRRGKGQCFTALDILVLSNLWQDSSLLDITWFPFTSK